MLQWARWKIFKTSMLHQSWNRPPMLSLPPNFYQSKRRPISIKFSEPWMLMETVSFLRRRSRMDTLNSSERVWQMSRSTRCSPRSTLMEMVRSIILSSSSPPWTRRIYWATTSSRLPSRCSIRTVEVQSLRTRSSRYSLSDKIWMKLSFHRSSNKLMRMEMEKFLTKNSRPWCSRTSRIEEVNDIVRQ